MNDEREGRKDKVESTKDKAKGKVRQEVLKWREKREKRIEGERDRVAERGSG
jgi:uncharacterized protein YjbJ (UPF0337 family)